MHRIPVSTGGCAGKQCVQFPDHDGMTKRHSHAFVARDRADSFHHREGATSAKWAMNPTREELGQIMAGSVDDLGVLAVFAVNHSSYREAAKSAK